MRSIRLFLALALMGLALGGFAHAADDSPRETLDSVKAALSDVDDELKLDTLTDNDLSKLRARAEPLAGQLQGVIADLTPRLDASRKRLAELKPKSHDGAAAARPRRR